ncbi:Rieske 2Fe-2S domain-containing protein [Streptomyces fuscichromogenes]|uniref:Rieske 2Fe-2S domain-containing protein n=1 Tax=Streptomyces fuscichromogenes TaxID=1324013 RepID=UPI003802BDDA
MGDYLREFWVPAVRAVNVKPGGDPVQVRVLGVDVVVFRGADGSLGCVDEKCPHRRASLSLAKNDGDRLTCLYHGWQFGTDGRCVDVPTEPADKRAAFAARVQVNRHPVAESSGMIWVYLGDPDNPPPLPDFQFNSLPADRVCAVVGISDVNWLQCLEGLTDTVHVGQLHQAWLPSTVNQLGDVAVESAPTMETVNTDYGLRSCGDRPKPDGTHYIRVTEYVAPFWSFIPHGPKEDRATIGIVPIDDTHTMQWYVWYDDTAPLQEGTDVAAIFEPLRENPDDFTAPLRGKPKWGQDRAAMGGDHFSGLPSLVLEDVAVQESQGVVMDRTKELLGSSDQFVMRTRRLLMKAARGHQETGAVFPDPRATPLRNVRSLATDIAEGEDWKATPTR